MTRSDETTANDTVMTPLIELWRKNPAVIEAKTFQQIIQFSGKGVIRDENATSTEIRSLLAAVPLDNLDQFANECMNSGFTDSGLALQDIINELGVRLGFAVTPGRYRGRTNEIGYDGLWQSTDGHVLLVEVKTTDTYRINLETIAGYRQRLIESGQVSDDKSSILVAVGRQDTGDLEAQIRGSKHAWDVRLVSIDALLRLASVKEQMNDWTTSMQINQVLRPIEYTRVDQIVELLFQTSRDIEDPKQSDDTDKEGKPERQSNELSSVREAAVRRVSNRLKIPLIKKGRALRSSSDGQTNIVVLVSQRTDRPGDSGTYWYGFTKSQREFLEQAKNGYLVFACIASDIIFMLDREVVIDLLPQLATTRNSSHYLNEISHWHINFKDYGNGRMELITGAGQRNTNLSGYLIT